MGWLAGLKNPPLVARSRPHDPLVYLAEGLTGIVIGERALLTAAHVNSVVVTLPTGQVATLRRHRRFRLGGHAFDLAVCRTVVPIERTPLRLGVPRPDVRRFGVLGFGGRALGAPADPDQLSGASLEVAPSARHSGATLFACPPNGGCHVLPGDSGGAVFEGGLPSFTADSIEWTAPCVGVVSGRDGEGTVVNLFSPHLLDWIQATQTSME